jgi:hypothetical protein
LEISLASSVPAKCWLRTGSQIPDQGCGLAVISSLCMKRARSPGLINRPSRPACIWPVQRGARPTLPLCGLCPLRKSPCSQSNPTPLALSSACGSGVFFLPTRSASPHTSWRRLGASSSTPAGGCTSICRR